MLQNNSVFFLFGISNTTIRITVTGIQVRTYTTFCSTVNVQNFLNFLLHLGGTAVAQWLRCCATNLKVAGLIPADITRIFH